MHKDGYFEQLLFISHVFGEEGLKAEQNRILKYQSGKFFDEEKVSIKEIETVLRMIEMLLQ